MYLRKKTQNKFAGLKDVLYPVSTIHNVDFCDMVEEHEKDHEKSL